MRKLDPPTLKRAAIAYLGRYAASASHLRSVLARKAVRWRRLHRGDAEGDGAMIEAAVAALAEAGLVDDAAYAATKTASLAHRGWPARRIAQGLAAKGVGRETIAAALSEADDAAAAQRFARKRRLGPWRGEGERAARREKDIAAMLRAGFSHALARQTIDGGASTL